MVCIYLLTMLLDQQLDQLILAPSSRPQPHAPHIPKEDRGSGAAFLILWVVTPFGGVE